MLQVLFPLKVTRPFLSTYPENESKKEGVEGMYLYELSEGEQGKVQEVHGQDSMCTRLRDIGFTRGTLLTCLGKSPLGDPTAYLVRGAVIALRKEDAAKVLVEREG